MAFRVFSVILILFLMLFLPFWISLILAILGMVYFRNYWEMVVVFFVSDLLFGVKEARFIGFSLLSTVCVMAILLTVEFIKRKSKFYKK